jgi:hypothetical protein
MDKKIILKFKVDSPYRRAAQYGFFQSSIENNLLHSVDYSNTTRIAIEAAL